MNVSETLQLLQALKACGATRFESQDFKVHMGASASHEPLPNPPLPAELAPAQPVPVNEDATEKLKGLIETLKMDDTQLIDKIFPAGAGM